MKWKRKFEQSEVIHVTSEPGDHTRYDYLVIPNYDDFNFVGWGSTFPFPQKLNYWEIKGIETLDDAAAFIKEANINVNPYTLMECVRTIKELK